MSDTENVTETVKRAVTANPTLSAVVVGAGYYGGEIAYGLGSTIGP